MGVSELVVDGEAVSLDADELWLGPETGKRAERHGPFNQVFHKPFCLIYDASVRGYASHAAYLSSHWALQGNGSACGLPLAAKAARGARNPVFIGGTMDDLERPEGFPVSWDDDGVVIDGEDQPKAGLQFIAPIETARRHVGHDPRTRGPLEGRRRLARSGMPDYLSWTTGQALMTGHFDAEWRYAD